MTLRSLVRMTGQRHCHFQLRPRARMAVQRQFAAQTLSPFPHPDQPEMPVVRGKHFAFFETSSVIFHPQPQSVRINPEPQRNPVGARVLQDVRHAFLRDPQHVMRYLFRQLRHFPAPL